jgi:AcrR family transcriptional regulator
MSVPVPQVNHPKWHTCEMSTAATPRRGRGRPFATDVEQRVFEAAIQIYAEAGWAGFTFDAIAERSRTGKAAIYRRWASKLDIFRDAWAAASVGFVHVPDTGELRGDLLYVVSALMERLDQPVGLAELRLLIDVKAFPEEFGRVDASRVSSRLMARETIDRAVARGELPAGTRPELVFDLVRGAAVHNFLQVPTGMEEAWRARRAALAEEVVDVVLAGLRARAPGGL